MKAVKPEQITDEMIAAGKTVFIAMAYVETLRPIVRAYQEKVLKRFSFLPNPELEEESNAPILTPGQEYLLTDEDAKKVFAAYNEERKKAGLKVESEDHCPLCVAEHLLTKAKWALVEALEPLTGLTHDMLMRKYSAYKEYIEISLRMLAPFVETKI